MAALQLENSALQINGWKKDGPCLVIGHGGAKFKAVETEAAFYGGILFNQEITDRGWPETSDICAVLAITKESEAKLRRLFKAAAKSFLTNPTAQTEKQTEELEHSILSAIDEAVRGSSNRETNRIARQRRYFNLVEQIDNHLLAHIGEPVYSSEFAQSLGVSVRAVAAAVNQYRGMSLHKYVRLKRLWLTRQALLDGNGSIKTCAMKRGFWHMGEFTRIYRAQFNETPSQTLQNRPS